MNPSSFLHKNRDPAIGLCFCMCLNAACSYYFEWFERGARHFLSIFAARWASVNVFRTARSINILFCSYLPLKYLPENLSELLSSADPQENERKF